MILLQVHPVPDLGAVEGEVACCEEGDEKSCCDAEPDNLGVGQFSGDAEQCRADDEQVHNKPQRSPLVH